MTRERPLILFADDEPDIRGLVAVRLDQAGYDVVEAVDGREALEVIRERAPDLCVLDVMMPVLSGIEVTKAIKSDEALAGIPVIMLTARVTSSDVESGMDAGADEYIYKPFNVADLTLRIERALGRKS